MYVNAEAQLRGDFWFHDNVFKPHIGGGFTEAVNVYPNHTAFSCRGGAFLTDTRRCARICPTNTIAVAIRRSCWRANTVLFSKIASPSCSNPRYAAIVLVERETIVDYLTSAFHPVKFWIQFACLVTPAANLKAIGTGSQLVAR